MEAFLRTIDHSIALIVRPTSFAERLALSVFFAQTGEADVGVQRDDNGNPSEVAVVFRKPETEVIRLSETGQSAE